MHDSDASSDMGQHNSTDNANDCTHTNSGTQGQMMFPQNIVSMCFTNSITGQISKANIQAQSLLLQEDDGKTEAERVLTAHMQAGHLGFAEVRSLLGLKASKDHPICHSCELMRAQKASFTHSQRPRADGLLKRIWIDIGFGTMSKLIFQVY